VGKLAELRVEEEQKKEEDIIVHVEFESLWMLYLNSTKEYLDLLRKDVLSVNRL